MTPFAPHFGQGAPSFSAPVPSQCGQVSSRSSVAITMNIPPFLIVCPSPVTFHGYHLLNDTKKPRPSKDEVFAVPPLLTAVKPSLKKYRNTRFQYPFLDNGERIPAPPTVISAQQFRSPFGTGRGSVHSGHRLSEPRALMRTYSSSALFIRSFILTCIIRCLPGEVNNLSNRTGRAFPAPFAYAPLAPFEAQTSLFP